MNIYEEIYVFCIYTNFRFLNFLNFRRVSLERNFDTLVKLNRLLSLK